MSEAQTTPFGYHLDLLIIAEEVDSKCSRVRDDGICRTDSSDRRIAPNYEVDSIVRSAKLSQMPDMRESEPARQAMSKIGHTRIGVDDIEIFQRSHD